MYERRGAFSPPQLGVLRWLTHSGHAVTAEVSSLLLKELFSSPAAVLAGVFNGLILNVVALAMGESWLFAFFIVLDLASALLRIAVGRRAAREAARLRPTPTDLYLLSAACWCAIQGAMVFCGMRSGNASLQLLSATTAMGLIAPICARNYAAPRYAMMLVMFCDLPLVAGAALSGNPWLLILVAQTPLFLFGVRLIIRRFQSMAFAAIQAERRSYDQARHDSLTGLLNRLGIMEVMDAYSLSGVRTLVVFYLDLDGFKLINDRYGHPVGDKILEGVAERLRSTTRHAHVLSRLGGDEFVIFARDMSPDEAPLYAETIIRAVSLNPFMLPDLPPLRVGISVGYACSPEDGASGLDLQRNADQALYDAKRAGRGVHRRFQSTIEVYDVSSTQLVAV